MGKYLYTPITGRVWRMADPRGHNSVMLAGRVRSRVCFGRLVPGWSG
jgi:hypothetical protein